MKPHIYIFKGNSEKAYEFVLNKAFKKLNKKPKIIKLGKPYLEGFPDFQFNISHSGDLCAVAFADCPVGVDIETHREVNLKIAERYFSKREKDYVNNNISFFYVWTRKEAYLKMLGIGLKGLSGCDVLENRNIKTVQKENFTLSVCCDTETDFDFIYEENF